MSAEERRGTRATLHDDVCRDGITYIRDVSASDFKHLMRGLGIVHRHPDADPEGVTRVTPDDRSGHQPGAGFSARELHLHTDRSSLPTPPRFLGFYFERQAGTGGVPLFADLRVLTDTFELDELEQLTIATKEGVSLPLVLDEAAVSYRFRDDPWWTLEDPEDLVSVVRHRVDEVQFCVPSLTSGDAYVLDNHRVAHGRTAFVDFDREALRILADEVC